MKVRLALIFNVFSHGVSTSISNRTNEITVRPKSPLFPNRCFSFGCFDLVILVGKVKTYSIELITHHRRIKDDKMLPNNRYDYLSNLAFNLVVPHNLNYQIDRFPVYQKVNLRE